MAVWLLARPGRARRAADDPPCRARGAPPLYPAELLRWRDITRRMYVPIAADGIISQFEGYRDCPSWTGTATAALRRHPSARSHPGGRGPLGGPVPGVQAGRRADAFFLLSADELRELLGGLGYALPPEAIPRTIEYYVARTAHGPRSAPWCTPGCWPGRIGPGAGALRAGAAQRHRRCPGGTHRGRCPPRRHGRHASTCCSAASPASRPATTRSGSTPTAAPVRPAGCRPPVPGAARWRWGCPGARCRSLSTPVRAVRSGVGCAGQVRTVSPGETVRFSAAPTAVEPPDRREPEVEPDGLERR